MTLQKRVSRVVETAKRASLNTPKGGAAKAANANNALINSVSNDGFGGERTIMEKLKDLARPLFILATVVAIGFAIATFFSLQQHATEDKAIGMQILEKAQQLEQYYNEIRQDLDVFVDDPMARVICDESMQMQSNLDDVWGMKILSVGTGIPVPVDPDAPIENAAENESDPFESDENNDTVNVESDPFVTS